MKNRKSSNGDLIHVNFHAVVPIVILDFNNANAFESRKRAFKCALNYTNRISTWADKLFQVRLEPFALVLVCTRAEVVSVKVYPAFLVWVL